MCQFFRKSNWTNFTFYCMSQLTVSGQLGDHGQHARSRAVVALSRVRARVPTLHHNTMGVRVQIPLHQPKPAILSIVRVSVIIFYWNNFKNTFIPRPLCYIVHISLQSMGGWAAGAPGARAPSRAEEEHRIGWGHVQTPPHSTAGRCVSEQRRTPRTAIHKSA